MAEIVFMAKNKGADSGCNHRLGDPLIAKPDGFSWGANEDKRAWIARHKSADGWPANFVTLRITGLSVERAMRFIEPCTRPATAADPEFNAPDIIDRKIILLRKQWKLNIVKLPNNVKNELSANGFAIIRLSQIRQYFCHKINGKTISA